MTVESQLCHFENLIITMVEAWNILTAQLLIFLEGRVEISPVAFHEIHISRHSQREGEIFRITLLGSDTLSLLQPFQRLTAIFQAEHLCHTVIGAHGELRIIIAHLIQSLRKVLLCLDAIVAGAIDIAQQS